MTRAIFRVCATTSASTLAGWAATQYSRTRLCSRAPTTSRSGTRSSRLLPVPPRPSTLLLSPLPTPVARHTTMPRMPCAPASAPIRQRRASTTTVLSTVLIYTARTTTTAALAVASVVLDLPGMSSFNSLSLNLLDLSTSAYASFLSLSFPTSQTHSLSLFSIISS